MKKLLSILLTCVIILSLPLYSYAQELTDAKFADETITTLSSELLGISSYSLIMEDEPNDYRSQSNDIYEGSRVYGYCDVYDSDYFNFYLNDRSQVTLTCLSDNPRVVFAIEDYYAYDGYYAAESLGYYDGYYRSSLTVELDSGSHYIFVVDAVGDLGNYLFQIDVEELGDHTHSYVYDWNSYVLTPPSLTQTGKVEYECENEFCYHTKSIETSWIFRFSGSTRYETSFEIANATKSELGISKFDNIIVASGKNFADALAGSYLAKVKKAPIIMASGANNSDIVNYVASNLKSGGKVYILGGTAAVPESTEKALKSYNVKRLKGKSRYETNIEILKEANVTDEEIIVATGLNFADSLSASAVGKPILLVDGKKGSLSDAQKTYIKSLNTDEFYIVGGTAAVSEKFEDIFERYGSVERIKGANRYETSIKIAEEFFHGTTSAVLAYSQNFPDGLCGGPLAMAMDAPLILTQTGSESSARYYTNGNDIVCGAVLGGQKLISDESAEYIFNVDSDVLVYMDKGY